MITLKQMLVAPLALLVTSPAAMAAGAKITGKIVDDEGKPVVAAVVRLVPSSPAKPTLKVKTKKKGQYLFVMVRGGRYRLEVASEDHRVAEVDILGRDRDGRTSFEMKGPLKPGSPMPEFNVTDTDSVTYDLTLAPAREGTGEFGTGVALKGVGDLVAMIQGGRAEEARAELARSLEAVPDDAKLHYLLAYLELNEGNIDAGLEAIDRTLELDAAFPGAALLEGALLEEAGEVDGALGAYRSEATATSDPKVRHDAWVRVATLCQKEGREDCASAALGELVSLDPTDSTAVARLIDLHVRRGEHETAQAMLEAAPDDVKTDTVLLFNLGAGLWNQGDAATAVPYFERVLASDPGNAEAHKLLGYCRVSLKDFLAARKRFERYLELAPDAPDAGAIRELLAELESSKGGSGR